MTPEAACSPENGFDEDEEVLNGAELSTEKPILQGYGEVSMVLRGKRARYVKRVSNRGQERPDTLQGFVALVSLTIKKEED